MSRTPEEPFVLATEVDIEFQGWADRLNEEAQTLTRLLPTLVTGLQQRTTWSDLKRHLSEPEIKLLEENYGEVVVKFKNKEAFDFSALEFYRTGEACNTHYYSFIRAILLYSDFVEPYQPILFNRLLIATAQTAIGFNSSNLVSALTEAYIGNSIRASEDELIDLTFTLSVLKNNHCEAESLQALMEAETCLLSDPEGILELSYVNRAARPEYALMYYLHPEMMNDTDRADGFSAAFLTGHDPHTCTEASVGYWSSEVTGEKVREQVTQSFQAVLAHLLLSPQATVPPQLNATHWIDRYLGSYSAEVRRVFENVTRQSRILIERAAYENSASLALEPQSVQTKPSSKKRPRL